VSKGAALDAPAKVEQGRTFDRFSAATDLPVTVLTVAWLPVLIVPLFVHLNGSVDATFDVVDYSVWALFALEYVTKLCLARHRWHFVRTNLLDLLVVAVPVLRPLRALRLIRLTRIGIVGAEGLKRWKAIFTHKGLHVVLLVAVVLVVGCAGLVTLAEAHARGSTIHNFGQGLWWAVVTVTTVGYGDKYPITGFGQGVAVFLMLLGIGLIGVLTATIASFFVEESKGKREDEIVERLERIERALAAMAGGVGAEGVPSSNGGLQPARAESNARTHETQYFTGGSVTPPSDGGGFQRVREAQGGEGGQGT
jgi:voltage-gated potassium channel